MSELFLEVLPPLPPEPEPAKLRKAHTLPNLWQVWVGLKSIRAVNTAEEYQTIGKRFCEFFRDESGHRLDKEGMLSWMQYLKNIRHKGNPLGNDRINKTNALVKSFLKWLRTMDYLHADLGECLMLLPRDIPKPSVTITEQEYEDIKAYCAGRDSWQPHLWLIILGYRTGMSLVDCCHLRWKDVHMDEGGPSYLDIYRIKTVRHGDKARCQIPIVPGTDIWQWLINLKKVKPWKRKDGIKDYVHQETQGLYICTFSNIRQDFIKIFNAAGVPRTKTFKTLRNSLCSNLVNSGMQLALVCKVTGHNSVGMLLRYLKPDMDALQDAMVKAQQYSADTIEVKDNDGMENNFLTG